MTINNSIYDNTKAVIIYLPPEDTKVIHVKSHIVASNVLIYISGLMNVIN